MGFFSAECLGCGHSLLPKCSTDAGINEWMSQAVVLTEDGSRLVGEYDGYGRVGYHENNGDSPVGWGGSCWHQACWEQAGRPEYTESSKPASDQGFFFDDGDHDLLEPGVDHPEGTLEAAQAVRALQRQDQAEKDAIRNAIEMASNAIWDIDDEERREKKRAAVDALKEGFSAFVKGQPGNSEIVEALYGPDWFKGETPAGYRVFSLWFDAMLAEAQVAWLAERNFEVAHYVPGKSEPAWR